MCPVGRGDLRSEGGELARGGRRPGRARIAQPMPEDLHGGTEAGHHFRWVPARELGSVDFQPAGLIPILPELAGTLRHVVLAAS